MNPVLWLMDQIGAFATLLNSYEFWNVSLLMWFLVFIVINMVISVFWRGARG